ncbi:hypothetical protein PIB30_030463 [Stylosanthes scabra]|uniref:Uncharacterized protein n=1 Tax=Stylosanthes scabra TaxID=79078 RepID=A0ABU6UAZ3_9FABA|nr:hypothetical protein [Stylosanthes scabra]
MKEKARRHKEIQKQKRNKQRRIREELAARVVSSSDEEIDSTDAEVEEIWEVGRRSGLDSRDEDRAKKYLTSKTAEVEVKATGRDPECSRNTGRNKELGDQQETMGVLKTFTVVVAKYDFNKGAFENK